MLGTPAGQWWQRHTPHLLEPLEAWYLSCRDGKRFKKASNLFIIKHIFHTYPNVFLYIYSLLFIAHVSTLYIFIRIICQLM